MAIATQPISNELTKRLLAWMLSKSQPELAPDERSGRYVLTYCRPIRAVAWILTALAVALLVLSILGTLDDPKGLAICVTVFGLLTLGSLYMLFDVYVVCISAAPEGLLRRGILGDERRVPWSAVTQVDFSPAASWFRFIAPGHPTIRVSLFRDGLVSLARLAHQQLREEVAQRLPGELPRPGSEEVPRAA